MNTLKTAKFDNDFGTFHYQNVKESLYFGYEIKMMPDGRGILMATPEKALLDLLYLNPYYTTAQDMEELRLDEDFMSTEFTVGRLAEYVAKVGSRTLEKRVSCLKKVYSI